MATETYRRIRSLARGIEVLRYLNTVKGAHPVDIGKELGLARPTVHRVLETLQEMGLVYQGAYSREFRITPGVRRLAASVDKFNDLRSAAWPAMRDLTEAVDWPSDLAVFEDDAMLIIESTHRLSPISSDIGMVGKSRPMLESPLGRAYLSHCCQPQRERILSKLPAIADADALDSLIEAGRRDGFSLCEDLPHERCASMAVPVRIGRDVVASLNVVWHIAELTFPQAREQLAKPLLAARDRIEARLLETEEEGAAEQSALGANFLFDDAYIRRTPAALYGQSGV